MKSHPSCGAAQALALVAVSLFASTAVVAAPRYNITPLSAPAGAGDLFPTAINDSGQIVGFTNPDDFDVGFSIRGGQFNRLTPPTGGVYSFPAAVNNFGQIAGRSDDEFIPRAALWQSDTAQGIQLPAAGGPDANVYATSLNDAGVIVGFFTTSGSGNTASWTAVRWQQDSSDPSRYRFTRLDVPTPPTGAAFTAAHDINKSGQIVGTGPGFGSPSQVGLTWNSAGQVSELETPTGIVFPRVEASAVNDNGTAAGSVADTGGNQYPLLWSADRHVQQLDLPAGINSLSLSDINNSRVAVGSSFTDLGVGTGAWAWSDGAWSDLNARLVEGGWHLDRATAINSSGAIVGVGTLDGVRTGFLLSPIANSGDGDYNFDGVIDTADFTIWQQTFGSASNLAADGNGNGIVDASDYAVWRKSARSSELTSPITVPEPKTIFLLAVGFGALCLGLAGQRS